MPLKHAFRLISLKDALKYAFAICLYDVSKAHAIQILPFRNALLVFLLKACFFDMPL
jgi:hypothetical protein